MDTVLSFKTGETVIEEGDEGSWAYVILSGKAKVFKHTGLGEVSLAVMENGQVFGEMALIEDRPRSASVKAETTLKLRVINREQFNELLRQNPSRLIPIMKSLFERLRQSSDMLAERIEGNLPGMRSNVEVILEGQSVKAKNALNDRKLLITQFPFRIGRHVPLHDSETDVFYNNNLAIEEEKPFVISRNHLSINYEGGKFWVVDRGSAFGVVVNGQEIGGKNARARIALDLDNNQLIIGPPTSGFMFLISKKIS
jgi:pSer/pThr/pTyr-binding forkhead associated (FHA) protein